MPKNKHFTISKKIRNEIQLDLIRWALISCQHRDRRNKSNFRYLNSADFFGACSVLPPTCWFHRPPAPSSRWRRRGWRTRGASALASCTWACPSAGRCGLSSALAWPFGPPRRSEKHTHTHLQIMQPRDRTSRFPGFPLEFKNIKWILLSVSSMLHEVMPHHTNYCSDGMEISVLSAEIYSSDRLSLITSTIDVYLYSSSLNQILEPKEITRAQKYC